MEISKSTNTRYAYIDYTKGFGILLIMMNHCIQYFTPMLGFKGYVGSFFVPIFFVASGCLAYYTREKAYPFLIFLKKRAKAILIPYVLFSLLNSALKLGVLFITNALTAEGIQAELTALLITGNGTVWFLSTLFLVELVFWLGKRLEWMQDKSVVIMVILTAVCLISPYLMQGLKTNPFGQVFLRTVAGCGYYAFGFLMARVFKNIKEKASLFTGLLLILSGVVIYIFFGSNIEVINGTFSNMPASIACSLLSSTGYMFLFRYLDLAQFGGVTRVLSYYGKNSLIAMLVHPTLLLCFTYPLGDFFASCLGVTGVMISLGLWLVIVVLEIPFIWLINNKMPWVIGRRKERN